MKIIYEKPIMQAVVFEEIDIVTISGEESEPSGGSSSGGPTSGTFDEILGGF